MTVQRRCAENNLSQQVSPPARSDDTAARPAPTTDATVTMRDDVSTRPRVRGLVWLVAASLFMQALAWTIVNTAVPMLARALGGTPPGRRARAG